MGDWRTEKALQVASRRAISGGRSWRRRRTVLFEKDICVAA